MNEFDVLLARKLGGSGDTYTKAQIDAKLAEKVGFSDVDSALSTTSENPVQNKVITDALGGKVGTTDYATAATAGIVKSDGITTTVDADGTIHAAASCILLDFGYSTTIPNNMSCKDIGDLVNSGKEVILKYDNTYFRIGGTHSNTSFVFIAVYYDIPGSAYKIRRISVDPTSTSNIINAPSSANKITVT